MSDSDAASTRASGLSAREAAERIGVNERTVRRAIQRGLAATKFAGTFLIKPVALTDYARRLAGQPPIPPALPATEPPISLPVPINPLVGRDQEVASAAALLRGDGIRLLTLTGPGGVGKTRLAIAVAGAVADSFPGGVWFVPVADVTAVDLALSAVAQAVGVRLVAGPAGIEQIAARLRGQPTLLVLDNVEQIVEAAPDLAALLTATPGLKLLVTSREALRLSAEHTLPVPPLNAPDPSQRTSVAAIVGAPAVQLFVARAQSVRAGYEFDETNARAVAAICRRLDGLPLAIELAASRVRLLPPTALLSRLSARLPLLTDGPRDAAARHRTMRAAISWSYDLLDDDLQALFRRFAVFSGGASLGAVESIVSVGPDPVLNGLYSLIDKNLIRSDPGDDGMPRFSMLETIRELAADHLVGNAEESDVRNRHAAWYLELVEQIEPHWQNAESGRSLNEIGTELGNMRAALDWFARTVQADDLLRLAIALCSYWMHVGYLPEGVRYLDGAVELGRKTGVDPHLVAQAMSWLGQLRSYAGDRTMAHSWLEQALALRREIDDRAGIAYTLHNLADLAETDRDELATIGFLQEATELFRTVADPAGLSMVQAKLSDAFLRRRDVAAASAAANEALSVARAAGHALRATEALGRLAQVALARNDVRQATIHAASQLEAAAGLGSRLAMTTALIDWAATAAALGQGHHAVRILAAGAAARAELTAVGLPREWWVQQTLSAARRWLNEEAYQATWEAGSMVQIEDAIREALSGSSNLPAAEPAPFGLTARERDVLRLLVEGCTDREIAAELSLSYRTVTTYVTNILTKLDSPSRTAAATFAVRHGLV